MLMKLKIKFSYQDKPFIEELSVKFKKNKITSIIGLMVVVNRLY